MRSQHFDRKFANRRRLRVERLDERCLPTVYNLIDLGALGGSGALPLDINEAGQVIGYSTTAAGQSHAFLWDHGVMTDLGTLGGPHSTAGGLNDSGQIVGNSRVAAGNFTTDAFLWNGGVMTSLGILKQASAEAINNSGQIVGAYTHDPIPPSVASIQWAFLWDNGVVRDLFEGSAADINESGQVAGAWESTRNYPVAALWDAVHGPRELGVLPGGVLSAAYGLNDLGQVVGWSESWDGNHGFLWQDGAMFDLGLGTAADINNAGQIVGYANGAAIWTNGVAAELSNLVPAGSGLNLLSATAINEAGQIVVYAADAQGVPHAVLLNPLPEDVPVISIGDTTVAEGNARTTSATFTVTLSAASSQTISVAFATANGTAVSGSDYQSAAGTITFAPGETMKTVAVPVIGDRVGEPNETFAVNLSQPTNAAVTDSQAIGTIIDDEPRITISDVSRNEGNSGTTEFVFTVTLSAAYDAPVSANYATANGAAKSGEDYNGVSGALAFAPGETTKTITVFVKADKKKESDETFFLNLSGAQAALILDGQGIGTILDDDR